jgi:hypothetical protein
MYFSSAGPSPFLQETESRISACPPGMGVYIAYNKSVYLRFSHDGRHERLREGVLKEVENTDI